MGMIEIQWQTDCFEKISYLTCAKRNKSSYSIVISLERFAAAATAE